MSNKVVIKGWVGRSVKLKDITIDDDDILGVFSDKGKMSFLDKWSSEDWPPYQVNIIIEKQEEDE